MVDADILADFDLDSGSEKEFFMEQLRIAPPEEVDMLLSSLKRTVNPAAQTVAPIATDATDDTTQSLLKLEVADFAKKRAAALPQGIPTKEMLNDFKEEVYMYGVGLNLGETQALLSAAKAEADIVKARGLKTMKNQLALPEPPLEAINKTIQHFTKIQDAVGELFKDLPQSWAEKKPAADSTATASANTRKRGRPSKGRVEMAANPAPTAALPARAAETHKASKRQKTNPETVSVADAEQGVPSNDPPKLTRKQKQELYRQELAKKKPVIGKKVVPTTASAIPAPLKATSTAAVVPSLAPPVVKKQPQDPPSTATTVSAQKKRQRARKSGAQKQLEKAANAAAAPPPPTSTAAPPNASAAEADGFVDMRAPKKKKRGRKSTGPGEEVAEIDAALQAAPPAAISSEKTCVAEKIAAPASKPAAASVIVKNVVEEADKDNKNKSKRQNKVNKRKSVGNDFAPALSPSIAVSSTVVSTPAKSHVAAVQADKPTAVKQTPIPPPSRVILPPQSLAAPPKPMSVQTPGAKVTQAASIPPPSNTPILPPSSVSKLVLKKSSAVAEAAAPILPGASLKTASATPLAGISAPNSSSKGRKRGPRKSDVSAVNADEPKENHS